LQIDASAGTSGATQQQLVPDVRSAAEWVPPSLACAATFVLNAASSIKVIIDIDGLLQGKARQGVAEALWGDEQCTN